MPDLTLAAAQTILTEALALARRENLKPLAIAVLDRRGAIEAAAVEDGASLKRFEVAHGKAHGALALGMGSRSIQKRAEQQPTFVATGNRHQRTSRHRSKGETHAHEVQISIRTRPFSTFTE